MFNFRIKPPADQQTVDLLDRYTAALASTASPSEPTAKSAGAPAASAVAPPPYVQEAPQTMERRTGHKAPSTARDKPPSAHTESGGDTEYASLVDVQRVSDHALIAARSLCLTSSCAVGHCRHTAHEQQ